MNEDNTQQEAELKAKEIKAVRTWLKIVDNQVKVCNEHLFSLTKVFEEMSSHCKVLETLGWAQSLFLSIHRYFVQLREGTLKIKLEESDENDPPDYLISTGEVDMYRTTLCVTYLEGILNDHKQWLGKKEVS